MPHFADDGLVLVTQRNSGAHVHRAFGAHSGPANRNIGEMKDAVLRLAGLIAPQNIDRVCSEHPSPVSPVSLHQWPYRRDRTMFEPELPERGSPGRGEGVFSAQNIDFKVGLSAAR
jgi:hypothetical protein